MHLLQSGTDLAGIALWLGHESPATTHQYLEADLAAKQANASGFKAKRLSAGSAPGCAV